ncbi:MAG: hypothetical protein ACI8WB_000221 [Phenylobacterium sp.]
MCQKRFTLEKNMMLHFKPIKNRMVGFEFCCIFAVLCGAPVILYGVTGNAMYGESLKQFWPLFALIAYGFGHEKAKSDYRDINFHEEYVSGPGPFSLVNFKQKRVKISYSQLQILMKNTSGSFLFKKPILRLGETNGEHIRIIHMLYDQELFDALKLKLSERNDT